MTNNEGLLDRAIRLVVGLALLSLLAVGPVPGWGLVGLVGLIGVVTGLVGYCPTYTLFGIDTRSERERHGQTGGKTWSAS